MYSHVLAHVQRIMVHLPAWVFSAWSIARNQLSLLRSRTQPVVAQPVTADDTQPLAPTEDTQPQPPPTEPAQEETETQPAAIDDTQPVSGEPQTDEAPAQTEDTQPPLIDSTLPAQLDEMNARIIASISAGNYTPYAISKDTGIALTTLKRKSKDGESYSGRIPQLVAQGVIRNSSGADGTEYRLAK
jgi:hypothetical protein